MSQQLTEQSATTALRLLVGTLARKTSKHRWGVPLWSVVGDLVGLGSTSATELVQSLTPDSVLGCWCVNSDDESDPIVCHAQIIRAVWRERFAAPGNRAE